IGGAGPERSLYLVQVAGCDALVGRADDVCRVDVTFDVCIRRRARRLVTASAEERADAAADVLLSEMDMRAARRPAGQIRVIEHVVDVVVEDTEPQPSVPRRRDRARGRPGAAHDLVVAVQLGPEARDLI